MKHPDCFKCKYFFVTWIPHAPRGCRAFGFKTKNIPSIEVYNTSGEICHYFVDKNPPKKNNHYL